MAVGQRSRDTVFPMRKTDSDGRSLILGTDVQQCPSLPCAAVTDRSQVPVRGVCEESDMICLIAGLQLTLRVTGY